MWNAIFCLRQQRKQQHCWWSTIMITILMEVHKRRIMRGNNGGTGGGSSNQRGRRCRRRVGVSNGSVWTTILLVMFLLAGGPPRLSSTQLDGPAFYWLSPILNLAWALEATDNDSADEDSEEAPPRHHRPSDRLVESIKARSSGSSNQNNLENGTQRRAKASASAKHHERPLTLNQLLLKAGKSGLGGGIPGALAGAVQVITLMWLRTIINHQSRYGTTFTQAFRTLQNEGGIRRFYRGLGFALVQAPMSRFVSTAANDGVESFMANLEMTRYWGPGPSTLVASLVVGFWRMMLMPIDTCKTVLQVDSVEGFRSLMRRVKAGKIGVLYEGAIANALASIVGHFPWFLVYNLLSKSLFLQEAVPSKLLRNAGIGFIASIFSDTVVNAIRVVKTTKQAVGSKHSVTYMEIINGIVAADGWKGLFGRSLRTRIFANALQSIIFTIIWRGLAERWQGKDSTDESSSNTSVSETAEKAR